MISLMVAIIREVVWQAVYGGLDLIPLFAKAGAIVPLSTKPAWGGLEIPTKSSFTFSREKITSF